VFSFVASAGASIGLLAGGVITQAINWHWIFFVNLPIGVATGVLAVRLVDRDVGVGLRRGADVLGAALVTGALMLGVYTIVRTQSYGWGSARTLALAGLALGLLASFVAWEARAKNPLMPLRILRSRNVSGANLVQMLFVAGMFGMFFLGSLYMQRVLGYSALQIGLAFLPVAVIIGGLSLRVAPPLITRSGAKAILVPGLALGAAGLALLTRAPVGAGYVDDLLPSMLLVGVGAGLAFPALMTLAMSSAHPTDAGLASGLVNTTQQVGGALGLAVLATLSSTHTSALLHDGRSPASALTGGYHLAWMIGTGLLIAAIAAALTVLRSSGVAVPTAEVDGDLATPAADRTYRQAA
jgi:MFS family permease